MPTDPKPVPTKMTSADPRGVNSLNRAFKKPVKKEDEVEDEHAEFSSDKDSEHKKYMKSDSKPSY